MEAVRSRFEIVEILPCSAGVPPANEIQTDGRDARPTLQTPDLPALVAALASCDAILCHDSFPAHLAAALGKPVVTIFGSGEPDWFAPWNNRQRAVHKRVCPLHPCIDRCGMDRYICLEEIQPAEVLRQLELITFA
jgi:ADP-heptose:LPS heptosyltransferase